MPNKTFCTVVRGTFAGTVECSLTMGKERLNLHPESQEKRRGCTAARMELMSAPSTTCQVQGLTYSSPPSPWGKVLPWKPHQDFRSFRRTRRNA